MKREDAASQSGTAPAGPPAGDDATSSGATPSLPSSALQPPVSKRNPHVS